MMKSKGYSKGGAKMMKARGGKMAKGYSKGGAKMIKARGGKMAKGYSKGGAKMIKAKDGIGVRGQKSNASRYNVGKFDKTGKKAGSTAGMLGSIAMTQFTRALNRARQDGGKFTTRDIKFAYDSAMGSKKTRKDPMTKTKPVAKSRLTASGKRDLAAFNKKKK